MDLLLATNNKHKVKEIRQILKDKFENIYSLGDLNIDIDIVEDCDTFLGNSLKKAREISEASNMITLADDTGLEVDSLGGQPGVISARYAVAHDDKANNEKLLKNLLPYENRDARFVTCVVMYYPSGEYISAEGEVKGKILFEERGSNGFGYDPLFYSYDLKKSFGECSDEEKNSVSHRARAIWNLMGKL